MLYNVQLLEMFQTTNFPYDASTKVDTKTVAQKMFQYRSFYNHQRRTTCTEWSIGSLMSTSLM